MNRYRNWLKYWRISAFETIKGEFVRITESEHVNENLLEKHIHLFVNESISLCLTMSIEKVYPTDEQYTILFECNGTKNGEWNVAVTETVLAENRERTLQVQQIVHTLIDAVKEKVDYAGLEKELKIVSYVDETIEDAFSLSQS